MNNQHIINYYNEAPEIFAALQAVYTPLRTLDLDKMLVHLVQLRVSQINGCAFCVKMHTREAREDGESNERLDRVIVWRHVSDFTAAEKAALAWAEALTIIDAKTDYAPLRLELKQHYNNKQITALTTVVAMINLWNRIQVSMH